MGKQINTKRIGQISFLMKSLNLTAGFVALVFVLEQG
jgi:hypothetical protein